MFGENTGNNGGAGDIVTIVHGEWTKRVPEGTPNSTTRTNKAGNVVTEVSTTAVGGWVESGTFHEGEFGKSFNLALVDPVAEERLIVSFSLDSQHLMTFAKYLPNVDFTKKLVLGLGKDKEKKYKDGKPKVFLFVKQDEPVKMAFTKDAPNGLPEPKEGPRGWDWRDQEDFLLELLQETFASFKPYIPDMEEEETDEEVPF